jgi:hypothetical protein
MIRQSCSGAGMCATPRCWARRCARWPEIAVEALCRSVADGAAIACHPHALIAVVIRSHNYFLQWVEGLTAVLIIPVVGYLQGQKEINVLAAACKALATAASGKAAAKRAGKALEKVP